MHHSSAEEKVIKGSLAALDKKAFDLIAFDLRGLSDMADYFLICTGTTDTHVRAIADAIGEGLLREGVKMGHKEGYLESTWILLDYGDIVVHIFTHDKREYYDLERLWGDAPRLDLAAASGDPVAAGLPSPAGLPPVSPHPPGGETRQDVTDKGQR